MRLVTERNDWYSRYAGAVAGMGTVNPDLLPVGQDHSQQEHQAYSQTELNAASGAGTNKWWRFPFLVAETLFYTCT